MFGILEPLPSLGSTNERMNRKVVGILGGNKRFFHLSCLGHATNEPVENHLFSAQIHPHHDFPLIESLMTALSPHFDNSLY